MQKKPTRRRKATSAIQKNSIYFIEPEGSLPCPHKHVTCPNPEPGQSRLRTHKLFLQNTFQNNSFVLPMSSGLCLYFRFSNENPLCTSPYPKSSTRLAHFILLHFIALITFSENHVTSPYAKSSRNYIR